MAEFIIVRRYRDSISAHIGKSKLESAGIDCFLQDENFVTLRRGVNEGIKLLVNDFDVERADSLLIGQEKKKALKEYPKNLLQSTICPKCHTGNVFHPTSFLATILFLFISSPPFVKHPKKNLCQHCGFKWKSE